VWRAVAPATARDRIRRQRHRARVDLQHRVELELDRGQDHVGSALVPLRHGSHFTAMLAEPAALRARRMDPHAAAVQLMS
jgi:hypothetical protein